MLPHFDEYKHPAGEELSERDAKVKHEWKEAEERLDEIRSRKGPLPLPGEVACLVRIQRKTEYRGRDTTGSSKVKVWRHEWKR